MPTTRAPLSFRELPDDAADRARGRGDDDRLAGLRLDDLVEPVPGRDAGHADDAEIGGKRDRLGVDDFVQPAPSLSENCCQPPGPTTKSPGLKFRCARLDDLADRAAAHHGADLLRLGVALGVAEPAAHVGIEREIMVAHDDLPFAGARDRGFRRPGNSRRDFFGRAGVENDLFVDGHGRFLRVFVTLRVLVVKRFTTSKAQGHEGFQRRLLRRVGRRVERRRPALQRKRGRPLRRAGDHAAAAHDAEPLGAQPHRLDRVGGLQHHEIGVRADMQPVALEAHDARRPFR